MDSHHKPSLVSRTHPTPAHHLRVSLSLCAGDDYGCVWSFHVSNGALSRHLGPAPVRQLVHARKLRSRLQRMAFNRAAVDVFQTSYPTNANPHGPSTRFLHRVLSLSF
jgi:hypothetical protein